MAYDFVPASSQYLTTASSPVDVAPLTIAAWFNSDSVTAAQSVLSVDDLASPSRIAVQARGDVAGDPVRLQYLPSSGDQAIANTSTGYSQNTWTSAGGVFPAGDNRSAFIGGTVGAANTVVDNGSVPSAVVIIGAVRISSISTYFDGRIAEAAIWNVALTDAEVASLSKGFKPTRIRPQALVFYAPLIRNIQDTRGGRAITNNNTATVANHPRVY
jgi:hypothetical protein